MNMFVMSGKTLCFDTDSELEQLLEKLISRLINCSLHFLSKIAKSLCCTFIFYSSAKRSDVHFHYSQHNN